MRAGSTIRRGALSIDRVVWVTDGFLGGFAAAHGGKPLAFRAGPIFFSRGSASTIDAEA